MKSKLLLPNRFKIIGWSLFIPATIAGIIFTINEFQIKWLNTKIFAIIQSDFLGKTKFFKIIEANITVTLIGIMFIIGAMLVGFSKEKREDEYIAELRLSSLLWAVWVNYALLLLSFIFVYGIDFLTVMMYNMFTVLLIFIVRFNYILYKNSKKAPDEK